MQRLRILIVLAASVVLLGGAAACSTTDVPSGEEQVTTYMGRDLLCRVIPGSHSSYDYDCDFVRFHAEPVPIASGVPRNEEGHPGGSDGPLP